MYRWLTATTIAVAAVGIAVAGCSPAHPSANGATASAPARPAVAAVRLTISPADAGRDVAPDQPIVVTAAGGQVRDVSVRTGGDQVSGSLDATHTTWRSSTGLNVSQTYTVTATGVDAAGLTTTATSTFSTLTPSSTFRTHIFEGDHDTYGVGMPIELTFSKAIKNKAAVEQALRVTTSQPVVGAWSWIDDEHVDFRPRDYWPAHTTVSFTGLLDGVQGAPGVYGAADLTQTFLIGDSLIVTASTTTHHMQLYRNGQLQYDWPISTGKPGHDTPNGTYLTIDKANPQEMKPSDIAPGRPGYYDVQVPWSVRFTWSGDFLHAASWSVGQQGSVDVSHGCVNMPPAAAQTYYQEEIPGDPVTITNSPLAGTAGDGWTDWFDSWQQLLDHSATHEAVQAGPDGSTFVAPSDLPASTASAPLTTSPANNAAGA
ncbi:L,D-transpeptidase [Amycolatopsis sp. K13G38]|uniref:L,D-transpeptidase n=1 Tax=Amycolatopsis acididurans TaxID=2724524 RepID=A0ABX1J064_9PSEU|nr:Ig-like domain-containing protein [Amycolatopsis acididurans]NKQ53163.1 L,D-transpeptidase [Amycolatopsis acididurans]